MTRHLGHLVHAALIVALAGVAPRHANAQVVPSASDIRVAAASANRTLWDSTFVEWPEDGEIVIGDVLYIPPIGSELRSVPGVLGAYRLNLGGGLGIHGTPEEE